MTEERRIDTDGGDYREAKVGDRGQYAEGHIYNYNVNPYKPGIPFQVPPVPGHFVPRPQYADRIREQLLCDDGDQPGTLVVSAIHGLGGIGKSVLAAAIAHEPAIRDRFPDGILWITLGQQPDLLVALGDWIRSLGDRDYKPTTVQAASSYLRSLLVDKTMLLVVDDLWDPAHFDPFRLAGKGCRVLVTTRQVRLKNAKPCELGLLTAAESVALVEGCLGQGLEPSEREIFEEFARAVGFLPLALELAAVQVEDGYDWASLLADFREEFDILDVDEGAGSDEVRRDRSLRACFNLSLKRLDGEQLRRFAWLGVLPEDVSVDARMVATLWGIKPVRARKGLLELRRRSLLLSAVSVSVGGRQEPTFRQHDLLHELAQKQLEEALGRSVEAAHGELLARYRPESGRWWELADDGYIHRRLTWHMERAGQIAEMHKLIRAADDNGRNAWGEACEELGLLTVFVEDVARAWRCAEERYGIIPTDAEGWRWQFWCAFAMGSLNSLVGNVSGELLATAVQQKYWSEPRAVAYALQKRKEKKRAKALAALISELRNQETVEAVVLAARAMLLSSNRDRVLVSILKHQSSFWPSVTAQKIAGQISNKYARAKALSLLSEKQSADKSSASDEQTSALNLLTEKGAQSFGGALEKSRQIADELSRSLALSVFTESRPDLLGEALEVTLQVSSGTNRVSALSALAENAPIELLGEVLEMARQIPSGTDQASLLSTLAERLPPELAGEALAITRQIPSGNDRISVLSTLIARLPSELIGEGLEVMNQIPRGSRRVSTMSALAKQLSNVMFDEALAITRQIPFGPIRASTLIALAEQQPELFREALEMAYQIPSGPLQVSTLIVLAEKQPELFHEVMKMTRQIPESYGRARILSALCEKLPPELLSEALKMTHQIEHGYDRALVLSVLAERLPTERLGEVLEMARQIHSGSGRSQILRVLAEKLPAELLEEALEMVLHIPSKSGRAQALNTLVKKLPPELLRKMLEALRQSASSPDLVAVLSVLAKSLPAELLGEVLDMTRQITYGYGRASILNVLAKKLPANLLGEAIEIADQIPLEVDQALALQGVTVKLPLELRPKVYGMVIAMCDPYHQARALAGFTDRTSWEAIARDHNENLLRLLSTRERKHLIELLPKLHPTLLELGGQPAVDAALGAMRDACNQWP
ncbi:MAG: NB-ARC domain-containing protein [Cyanophyceae cyanobacterium]